MLPLFILASSSCNSTPNETWHCYDSKGRPAADVLFICSYDLAADYRNGVNYRFSDSSGRVVLNLDSDTPRNLNRSDACIYSARVGDNNWNGLAIEV